MTGLVRPAASLTSDIGAIRASRRQLRRRLSDYPASLANSSGRFLGREYRSDVDLISAEPPVDDTVAQKAGTIGHEFLTSLGGRYRREYLDTSAGVEREAV